MILGEEILPTLTSLSVLEAKIECELMERNTRWDYDGGLQDCVDSYTADNLYETVDLPRFTIKPIYLVHTNLFVWKYFDIIFLRRKEALDNIKRTAVQDYDNIWARPTEKRLKNIRNRLSKANPFKRRKRLFSLKFRRWFAYAFFGLSALFMFLYYTDPTIFFRTQIGIMMLVGQFLYSFSILYAQLMSSIPNEYVPFVDAYWNIGMSVLVLAILYYFYYVVRGQRADFVFKVFQ